MKRVHPNVVNFLTPVNARTKRSIQGSSHHETRRLYDLCHKSVYWPVAHRRTPAAIRVAFRAMLKRVTALGTNARGTYVPLRLAQNP